ncbi:PRA1 family protein D-like [Cynara cardunculus var. scolymus]|uniref:PRA1 family protein n=1 Tax=Cynara cardunculus var. scolymus TaxID=59895 RepID=A0A124SAH0_CYNCS|nr:PRA1 family protein D-like [Cynara cardunculus var. scolymus]XP_024963362.1 PRA1 family protein D-like [Cynara cardunculus var. scolymus]XP_024963363.1 PRA1 family protein D-like [Cynara cardunculus var. scolymus]KVH87462.1 Prenylated rab acceptor PRA1 [Cynara cardunculus var. scolymus]
MTPSSTTTPPPPPPPTTASEIRHSIRPWFDDFLSLSSLSLPISFPQLSLRIQKNLYAFRANYLIVSIIIFLLTLFSHPITLISFLIIVIAWIYLVFARDEPLVVFDFEVGGRLVVILLSVVTVVALAATSVWWNIFVSALISALVVLLHAILRTPDDADDMESPYGALLSVVDEDGPARGPYTLV